MRILISKNEITYHKQFKDYIFKLSDQKDVEAYIQALLNVDDIVLKNTGSNRISDTNSIRNYFLNNIEDESRYDFIVLDEDKIAGEAVLSDIDFTVRSAHFRIAIFNQSYFRQGIGSMMVENTLNFAFNELNMHRVELEVFDFNKSAINLYSKFNFKKEGELRDSIIVDDQYRNVFIMSVLEEEFSKGE